MPPWTGMTFPTLSGLWTLVAVVLIARLVLSIQPGRTILNLLSAAGRLALAALLILFLMRQACQGLCGLLAPRPFLALTGDRDAGSPPEGMKKLEQILSRFYKLHGQPDRFQSVIYPETGHVYNDDMKKRMVEWFDRFL